MSTIKTFAPASWSVEDCRDLARVAVRIMGPGRPTDIDDETWASARGIYDPRAKARRLRILARAQAVADAGIWCEFLREAAEELAQDEAVPAWY